MPKLNRSKWIVTACLMAVVATLSGITEIRASEEAEFEKKLARHVEITELKHRVWYWAAVNQSSMTAAKRSAYSRMLAALKADDIGELRKELKDAKAPQFSSSNKKKLAGTAEVLYMCRHIVTRTGQTGKWMSDIMPEALKYEEEHFDAMIKDRNEDSFVDKAVDIMKHEIMLLRPMVEPHIRSK